MIKVIKIYIPFFVIASLSAGIFYGVSDSSKEESNVSYDQDEMYPENMRPQVVSDSEMEPEDRTSTEEEDLLSDENFVDFEVNEDAEPAKEEKVQIKEESQPEEEVSEKKNEEDLPPAEENTAEENTAAAEEESGNGTKIEILPEKVNAREQPESGAKIVTVFEQGQQGVLIEEGASWSVIKIGDNQGYVNNKFWKKI